MLARRSLIKTWRTPEALIDVTLQPVIFLVLFTYIFGGAIAGDRGAGLQFLLPGMLGQSIAMAGVALGENLNTDIEKGVFDRFRSLPIGQYVPQFPVRGGVGGTDQLSGPAKPAAERCCIKIIGSDQKSIAGGLPGRSRPAGRAPGGAGRPRIAGR